MTLPKKREDLEKIMDEVMETHEHHEHHHHHHHHEEGVEELLTVFELLIDSLNANVKNLESQVQMQAAEIVRLYKVLAKIVEACFSSDETTKRRALEEALSLVK
jgi:G3E family GTPase